MSTFWLRQTIPTLYLSINIMQIYQLHILVAIWTAPRSLCQFLVHLPRWIATRLFASRESLFREKEISSSGSGQVANQALYHHSLAISSTCWIFVFDPFVLLRVFMFFSQRLRCGFLCELLNALSRGSSEMILQRGQKSISFQRGHACR
ncbi:hypothetical protein F5880DRAFT_1566869 [Lentinula raphanica]|nr:hypothetical protein F5880DRAFT_1566869 [Lentinula raphanica]